MYTLPSRDIVLLYYVQNVWEWGGWCGISLIYRYGYIDMEGCGAEGYVYGLQDAATSCKPDT